MTTRKTKTTPASFLRQYGAWIVAAAFAAYVLFDPASGVDVSPAFNAFQAGAAAATGNLTIATFLEHMLYVLVSLVLVVGILRFFDSYVLGISFKTWYAKIKTSPVACALYTGIRFLAVCVLIGLIMGCAPAPSSSDGGRAVPERYDAAIEASTERWLGRGWTACRLKAQLYQESLLDPDAVSPAGAEGIAQFMPGTWREAQAALGFRASPRETEYAINAAGWYMRRMHDVWTSPRPAGERKRWAEASYNWGAGNMLNAQRRAGGSVYFADVDPHLPDETRTYVRRIQKWLHDFQLSSQC